MIFRRFIFLFLLALLSGCTPAARSDTLAVDDLQITLTTPDDAPLNRAVTFVVDLAASDGSALDGAAVYLDLDMPAMPMGVTRPIAEPRSAGRYEAMTAYTMSGLWEITVVVERPDGRVSRATFMRTVREEK